MDNNPPREPLHPNTQVCAIPISSLEGAAAATGNADPRDIRLAWTVSRKVVLKLQLAVRSPAGTLSPFLG
eukprot:4116064-Amphidinium_carterae.1